ncbi:MAG: nucleotidyltransferase domain-containing protein, partial [Chloroflexi bacterium]|nr:nucleotidyltransferase domain-containing protein [Chloroflexota bacterium]
MQKSPIPTSNLRDLFAAHPQVIAAWLFGSAHTGRMRADSDIDIGVFFAVPPTLDEWLSLHADLQDAFAFEDIDLVILNGKSPILRFEAISGQRLYCRSREELATFASLT